MTAPQPVIFLVDDDPVLLFTLGSILRSAGYTVEAFECPNALLARLSARDHGAVVLDLKMPGLSGLELQKLLCERGVDMPIIFVSGRGDIPAAVAAMKQGAVDFLSKPVAPHELLAVVARALRKAEARAAELRKCELAQTRWATLSPREQDVCRQSAKGLINKQIAAELGITESTVQGQRARAWKKLGICSATELVLLIAQVECAR